MDKSKYTIIKKDCNSYDSWSKDIYCNNYHDSYNRISKSDDNINMATATATTFSGDGQHILVGGKGTNLFTGVAGSTSLASDTTTVVTDGNQQWTCFAMNGFYKLCTKWNSKVEFVAPTIFTMLVELNNNEGILNRTV